MKNLKEAVQEDAYEQIYAQILLQCDALIFYRVRQQIWSQIGILVCEQHYAHVREQVALNEKS